VLRSQPTANVTLPVASNDASEGVASVASVTFTTANWNVPRTVTVTGVDEAVDDGDVAYGIVLGGASILDTRYAAMDPADVLVTSGAGLSTTEAGGAASFSVVLASQPIANVIIPVTSSDPTEGTPSAASLTFTPANWSAAQTVTVTGADDAAHDGDVAYGIVLGLPSSADTLYDAIDPADVAVTNLDNDAAGIIITPVAGLATTEAGGTANFTITLASQPTADVNIPVNSSDPSEGTASVASLTFTPVNWNVSQTITVTGVDDAIQDGDVAYSITVAAAASADPDYAGLDPADVALVNADNDAAGVTVTPVAGLTTTEAGGSATFTVVLKSQPTADVVIPVASNDVTEGTVAVSTLTFTAANW